MSDQTPERSNQPLTKRLAVIVLYIAWLVLIGTCAWNLKPYFMDYGFVPKHALMLVLFTFFAVMILTQKIVYGALKKAFGLN